MPVCDEGAAAARARPRAGIGHLTVWEQDAGWRRGNSPTECMTMDKNGPSREAGIVTAAGEEGGSHSGCATAGRRWPSLGGGTAMTACKEGEALARWRAQADIGELRVRGEGCRLTAREQRQRLHDCGLEVAIFGRGKSDGGLRAGSSSRECSTMDRNWRGGEDARGMPASGVGTAAARARPWTGMGHMGQRGE